MRNNTESQDYEPVSRPTRWRVFHSFEKVDQWLPGRTRKGTEWPDSAATPLVSATPKDETDSSNIPRPKPRKPGAILRGGHSLTFAGLCLFTIVLYFRPYEYLSSATWLTSSASWLAILTLTIFVPTQIALEGNLTARPREIHLVLLFCIAGLLSIPFAISPAEAWSTFNDPFIKAVVIFVVIVNVVRTPRRLGVLFFLTLAVSCVVSFNAIRDFAAGNLSVEGYRVGGSIGGMFGNPNDMALHLVSVLPIAIVLGLSSGILMRSVYWVVSALLVAAITVTYSRGGFLALIFVGIVLAWKLGRRNRIAVVLALVVCIVALLVFAPGNYGTRLASIFIPSLDPNGSRGARQNLLTKSVIVALRYPLFGIGMGNFHYRALQEQVSHNAYTQVAAEMGLPACVIYVKFLLSPLKRLRLIESASVSKKEDSYYYYLAVGLQASLIGFIAASFFASVAYYWYLYYLVGYAVSFRRLFEAANGVSTEEMLAQRKLTRARERHARRTGVPPPVIESAPASHEY